MTSDEAPLRGGGGKNSAPHALLQKPALNLFQGRLLLPVLALGGLLLLGCATSEYEEHKRRGMDRLHAMDYPAAVGEFREAHRLNPNDGEMHCEFGNALEHQGLHEEAEKEYREAPQLKPGDPAILRALAYFLDRQGKRKEARPFWEKALKVEKDSVNRGLIQQRLAEPD